MSRAHYEVWKGAATPRELTDADFLRAAATIGCAPGALRAVWEVEADGEHYLEDGSVVRRFEPHHFPRALWETIGYEPRPGEAPWRASLRQSSEQMFNLAVRSNVAAAIRASSWGAPQIMGFNARHAGFATPEQMVRAMAEGADRQLDAFVALITSWRLDSALRAHDWLAFARRYNGAGQPEVYARRIEAAWRRHGGRPSPQVLRVGDRGDGVRELQRALGVAEDGVFGPETFDAVQRFQERAGLPIDGIVGLRTWTALIAGPGTPVPVAPPEASPGTPQVRPPQRVDRDVPDPTVQPPAQEVPADAAIDVAGRVSGGTAIVSGAALALAQLREALPEDLFRWAIVLAALGGAAWLIARMVARQRRRQPVALSREV